MPVPDGFRGPTGHRDAEEAINLLGSLDRNDPRSAEVLVTYYCGGRVGGLGPEMALIKVGIPAVPYLIPYLLDDTMRSGTRSRAIRVLGGIAEQHREELGGIVEHIIIPRLEYILSDEFESKYYVSSFEEKAAREALDRLK